MILFWRVFGVLFFVIGIIGILVPVMPTVPFWLVALWAFGKGNPAWRDRLLAHPVYGPPLRTWEEQRAIPRRAKQAAFLGLAISVVLCSIVLYQRPLFLAMALSFLGGAALFIATRPDPVAIPLIAADDAPATITRVRPDAP